MSHRVVVIGGGNAGIATTARLQRAGVEDIAVIEPSDTHHYQPLWTLVSGGRAPASTAHRPQPDVMPKAARWIRDRAEQVDPDAQVVTLGSGQDAPQTARFVPRSVRRPGR